MVYYYKFTSFCVVSLFIKYIMVYSYTIHVYVYFECELYINIHCMQSVINYFHNNNNWLEA